MHVIFLFNHRPQNRRRHKSRDNDLQVLIIPNEESQAPDLHIYKILVSIVCIYATMIAQVFFRLEKNVKLFDNRATRQEGESKCIV